MMMLLRSCGLYYGSECGRHFGRVLNCAIVVVVVFSRMRNWMIFDRDCRVWGSWERYSVVGTVIVSDAIDQSVGCGIVCAKNHPKIKSRWYHGFLGPPHHGRVAIRRHRCRYYVRNNASHWTPPTLISTENSAVAPYPNATYWNWNLTMTMPSRWYCWSHAWIVNDPNQRCVV